ncbi:DUF1707 domain-containing protein [Micromonospora costi]|uniref:DUF1707 SHOCT-like domain-containing protein n=1 Tax=Micromonospora costi TaxID=1530042 RepID=UPI0033F0FB50
MDGRDGMRAADADRQAVAERLRAALDEGRLNLHEYDERLQRAYAARTYADLDALLTDLPAPAAPAASAVAVPPPATPAAVGRPAARPATRRWLAHAWLPFLQVVPIVVGIWAISSLSAGELLYFWPGWVAAPWGAVLLARTVTGLAVGKPSGWAAERQERRRRERRYRGR